MRTLAGLLSIVVGLIITAAVLPAHAEWESSQMAGMSVLLYRPSSAGATGQGRALFVVLHGCAQSPETLRERADFAGAAEGHGLVVALPTVPNGGMYAGCWDFYGPDHTREGRHAGPLLAMTEQLLADGSLGIDSAQVYLTGLSSGAGEAAVVGCLAPDVYAGVGIVAGPAVGTGVTEFTTVASTAEQAMNVCRTLAGAAASHFDTQLASVVQGDLDYMVTPGYLPVNADAYASLYGQGTALTKESADVAGLPGTDPTGERAIWSDARGPRVEMIRLTGMGHAWPGGTGNGSEAEFVASRGLDYVAHLAAFFASANRRVGGPRPIDEPQVEPREPEAPDPSTPEICTSELAPERVDGTLVDHHSRFSDHDGSYGVADASYVELLNQHGRTRVFPLYLGSDDRWYSDPANAPKATVPCPETDGQLPLPVKPSDPGNRGSEPTGVSGTDDNPRSLTHCDEGGCRISRPGGRHPAHRIIGVLGLIGLAVAGLRRRGRRSGWL